MNCGGGAGKLSVPGLPAAVWKIEGERESSANSIVFFGYFTLAVSLSFWETERYRLKYCFKGPLNPQQPIKIQ